jgi:hypothetical protein
MQKRVIVHCAASQNRFLSLAIGFTVLICSHTTKAGPLYALPKGVEPKITSSDRTSGLRLTKKEWVSLHIHTTVWEIAQLRPPKNAKSRIGEVAPVLTIVKQRSLGIDRRFDYAANSGFAVTIEHPRGTAKSTIYSIEQDDSFLDAFRFTESDEVEGFSDDEIANAKRYRGAAK